ncbi:antiporter inner membrane protein [Rickettsiales bacterium Ac37b]|nr:antiporter inner membrane protein [Rickettsiales bacterium Ac37b]
MSTINAEQVLNILKTIRIPGDNKDIVTNGYVSSIIIRNQQLGFAITLKSATDQTALTTECTTKLKSKLPIEEVKIVFTNDLKDSDNNFLKNKTTTFKPKNKFDNIKHIVTVSSCKGGVGKSTISVNLAKVLAKQGYKIGLVDADIYGPSIPHMLGHTTQPKLENNLILPFESHNIKSISIGHLISQNIATIWRGPMATKTLYKLLNGTKWGNLDLLLIDMPPGTGDIYLSLIENYFISGNILVSTPQEVALIDVRKSINMFQKVGVKILGIIENMSYFINPISSEKHYIFGKGGASKLAEEFHLNFLGDIPLDPEIRETSDHPSTISDNSILHYYNSIAKKISYELKL